MGNTLEGMEEVSMPWKVITQVENRKSLAIRYYSGIWTMKELCEEYGISRKTGYKWLNRFEAQGEEGLQDLSRRPLIVPHQTAFGVIEALMNKKLQYPKWGAKKLRRLLIKDGIDNVPSESTLHRILERCGHVKRRRRRNKFVREETSLTRPLHANHVWAVDFKGWFRTGDGQICEPLTVSDLHSRYVLACEGFRRIDTESVKSVFEDLFAKYGKPLVIRSDNGAPFSSRALCGLSRLGAWWISLNIEPELIKPGHPEQNGGHERMHRTLKLELLDKVGKDLDEQQKFFDKWRRTFNTIRPHEAIGMRCPTELYEKSERRYEGKELSYKYPENYKVRSVKTEGSIKWQGKLIYVSQTLTGYKVGIRAVSPEKYEVYFRTKRLGILSPENKKVLPMS